MKKLGMLALAAVLVAMFTLPAWAIESEFGGYWRTRFYQQRNYSGSDNPDDNRSSDKDFTGVDTRTRLYYTAIFSENLKFENRFEFNVTWGDGNGGSIGADGTAIFRIKHSYINANTGPVNWKVGIQGWSMARGFLMDDDASGIAVNYQGDMFQIPFYWIHAYEGDNTTTDENDQDADYYGLFPKFSIGDMFNLNPYLLYIYSKDAQGWARLDYPNLGGAIDDFNSWYLGIDADADFGPGSAWLTFIYQGGSIGTNTPDGRSYDMGGWLGAIGGAFDLGIFDIHGQGFYATGDDDATDTNIDTFFVPQGQSYYWSEIMGLGIFDNQASNNSPGDQIGNIWAINLGTTVKPMDKLKVRFDAWYAALAEDVYVRDGDTSKFKLPGYNGESTLGTELDLVVTYEVVQNLNLDLVGAYLFAGKATTADSPDDANPWELGARLSLSF